MTRSSAGSPITKIASAIKPLGLLACVLLAGCSDSVRGEVRQELRRPGGGLTAILTRDVGGSATSSVSDYVYVREDDGTIRERLHIYDADQGDPTIHWKDPYTLVVSVKCATVFNYENDAVFKRPGLPPGERLVLAQVLLEFGGICKVGEG